MKVFNKDKALRQIKLKQNKNTYIKKVSIVLSCFILLVGIMYFTFAKFEQNSEEYTLINGVVKYGGSGDIQLSYVVDGVSQSAPPAKGTGYKIKNVNCENGEGRWDKNEWEVRIKNITGKVKCNLEFEVATDVEVTIYSAPSDEIYYYDGSDKVIIGTTDVTGKLENALLPQEEITFYSSVAKDPNNLLNDYSKTIDVDDTFSNIYIMPNNVLYWYGHKSNIESLLKSTGWSFGTKDVNWNTNSTSVTVQENTEQYGGWGSSNPVTIPANSKVNIILENTRTYFNSNMGIMPTKNSAFNGPSWSASGFSGTITSANTILYREFDVPNAVDGYLFITIARGYTYTTTLYALWIE